MTTTKPSTDSLLGRRIDGDYVPGPSNYELGFDAYHANIELPDRAPEMMHIGWAEAKEEGAPEGLVFA